MLSSLSPLTREYVNLTGDYLWEDKLDVDETIIHRLICLSYICTPLMFRGV